MSMVVTSVVTARAHNPILDACNCEDCRFWAVMDPMLEHYRDTRERRESLELLKAVRLAPTLEVCEALLRGEAVPRRNLDPRWRKAYGI